MATHPDQRPPRRARALRFLRDAFLVGGVARGVSHGTGPTSSDHTAARATGQQVLRSEPADAPGGLIDRLPGWLVLAAAALIVAAAIILPR